ncbi:MAG: sterol desaturase family protein [Xanthobacteraceae bacterium]|nr:sterol desaturase family protein [Xanthobacteraceae bacterium]
MDWVTFERVVLAVAPDRQTLLMLGYVTVIVVFAVIEARKPGFSSDPARPSRWPTNFGIGLINLTLAVLTPVSSVAAAYWANRNGYGLLNNVSVPWWLAVALTVFGRSFAGYALHFVMHKTPVLWRIHRVHHSDTHLDVSTALRSHPVEVCMLVLVTASVAAALGMDPAVLAAYELVEAGVHVATHANFRISQELDRVLRLIFVTPNMHSLHHSAWHRETDSNYGTVFSLWDRLFGTYAAAPRGGYDAMQIGLKEIRDERAHGFLWQLKSPALDFRADRKNDAAG